MSDIQMEADLAQATHTIEVLNDENEALRLEVDRLRALIQHPQLYTGGSVPVSAEWYGRILKEQTNQ